MCEEKIIILKAEIFNPTVSSRIPSKFVCILIDRLMSACYLSVARLRHVREAARRALCGRARQEDATGNQQDTRSIRLSLEGIVGQVRLIFCRISCRFHSCDSDQSAERTTFFFRIVINSTAGCIGIKLHCSQFQCENSLFLLCGLHISHFLIDLEKPLNIHFLFLISYRNR